MQNYSKFNYDSFNYNIYVKALLLFLLMGLTACTGINKRIGDRKRPNVEEGVEEFVTKTPSPTTTTTTTTSTEDEKPPVRSEKKVAIILGPGGVKTFAHTGVLQSLKKAGIPIDYVIGIEWGTLIAGLYAVKPEINAIEWQLYKLKDEDLPFEDFLEDGKRAEGSTLIDKLFTKAERRKYIKNLNTPLACPSMSLKIGKTRMQRRGRLDTVLNRCLPYAPVFKPYSNWVASSFAVDEVVAYLDKKVDLIIYVNVLTKGKIFTEAYTKKDYPSVVLWHELRKHLNSKLIDVKAKSRVPFQVINVFNQHNHIFDYKNRKLIVLAGRRAGADAAKRIAREFNF